MPRLAGAFLQPPVEKCRKVEHGSAARAAAKSNEFKRFGSKASLDTRSLQPQQRMLDQGEQGNRIARIKHGFDQQPQQCRGFDIAQMPAAGIVGIDAETGKLAHHTPSQIAVGGDERCRLAFFIDRIAQGKRDGKRLFPFVGGFNQVDRLRGGVQAASLYIELTPRVGRFRRTQRFADHPLAQAFGGWHIVQMFHIVAQGLHCIEKLA